MAQTERALVEARDYAQSCVDRGREFARVVSVHMLTNGYQPENSHSQAFYGYAVETQTATGDDSLVILHHGEIPRAQECVYLIDDGAAVAGWYVAGWNESQSAIYLQRFPVNVDINGQPRMRADDPTRPVDFSGWMVPVRRAYHVKLLRRPEGC